MKTPLQKTFLLALLFNLLISTSSADDTEIFFSSEVSRVNPNVLFVLDVSGSMNATVAGSEGTVMKPRTLVRKIKTSNDDVEEKVAGSHSPYTGSSDLELVRDSEDQIIGLRFTHITIPQGATITSSYIQFKVDETSSGNTQLNIHTEQTDNALPFENSAKNVGNRNKSSSISWAVPPWTRRNARGADQKTPNLKTIVQQVVNRSGWEAGNALVFLFTGSGKRTAESYDGTHSGAPELTINYDAVDPKKTRLQIMQSALKTVLDNAPTNLNVGLMNYGEIRDSDKRLGIKFPIKSIEEEAYPIVSSSLPTTSSGNIEWWRSNIPEPESTTVVRNYISKITDWFWLNNWTRTKPFDMNHVGTTPIVDALYEAALYFRGESLGWGQGESGASWDNGRAASHPSTYEGEAIKWDHSICNSAHTRTKWGSQVDFANNQYGHWRCPSNPSNPSGTGSYTNCPATESCSTYQSCKGWSGGVCTSYSQPDESGNRVCLHRTLRTCSKGYRTKTRCNYKVCSGDYSHYPDYTTPIKYSCQRNFVVLLSDGKPQYSRNWDRSGNRDGTNTYGPTYKKLSSGQWSGLVDKTDNTKQFTDASCAANLQPFNYKSGVCGAELTQFLAKQDQSPIDGVQTVDTYAIGFGLGAEVNARQYLQSLVTTSDGYFDAEDEEKLATAFGNILGKVGATTSAYAAPGYTVNMKNTTENEDFIFIPVFDKKLAPTWEGNLKKFKLVKSNDAQGRGQRKIQGKNNVDAVSELGEFKESAIDYWSQTTDDKPDGYYVEKGGASALLTDPLNRKLYSDLSCGTSSCDLTIANNQLKVFNTENDKPITNAVLNLTPDKDQAYRSKLIKFIRGFDANDNPRKHMGDILHSTPVTLTYKKGNDAGEGKEQYIFAATNEGYLHVFNTKTGVEKFAFMPKQLLKNIEPQYLNREMGGHRYGIDGALSLWHDDLNHDDEVSSGEKVYLYFGFRRGGRAYYALDITDLDNPSLLWTIDANTSSSFSNLGYSWSKVYLTSIRSSANNLTKVAIFTGGYDNNQDDASQTTGNVEASYGNDIFIVNALTGNLLWSLQSSSVDGASDLKHSIPGGVRLLDLNRNGAVDRMYFADTGGNIWRLELNESLQETGEHRSRLIKLAAFGGSGADARKFYNEPDVSLLKYHGQSMLALGIGSGYRPHPMDSQINDHFFVILDKATFKRIKVEDFSTINLSSTDMEKITVSIGSDDSVHIDYGDLSENNLLEINKRGWYVGLPNTGEKVLADAITVDGILSFTSFVPSADPSSVSTVSDLCTAPATRGRLYSMNLLSGKPAYDLDWSGGSPTTRDVFTNVSANEIPGAPQRVFNAFECDSGKCQHTVDIRVGKKLVQASSYDRAYLESVYWSDPSN